MESWRNRKKTQKLCVVKTMHSFFRLDKMGVLWIVVAAQEYEIWFNWIVSGIFIVGGIWDLVRARTRKLTEEERIELTDERNQMLLLQTKSRAYDIMNVIYIICMIAFLLVAQIFHVQVMLVLSAGFSVLYSTSGLVNLIVSSYYDEI